MTPLRRCVGCREMKEKSSLIRIAATAENISPDISMKASGRGAYICKSAACLQKAHKSKGLERSLKRAVPSNIYSQLSEYLENATEQERLVANA